MPNDQEIDDDVEVYDPESTMMPVVNISQEIVRFEIAKRKYKLKPGGVAMLEGAYATRRQMRKGGDSMASVIELETNKRVLPATDPKVPRNLKEKAGIVEVRVADKPKKAKAQQGDTAGAEVES